MNLDIDLITFIEINPKWIIDLNVKLKTTKFLEDNTRENLDDHEFGSDLSYMTLKAQSMKEIIDN